MTRPFLLVALLCIAADTTLAITPAGIYEAIGPELDRAAVERGEVVWTGLPERETSDRALTGVLLLRLNAKLPEVMKAMEHEPAMRRGQSMAITTGHDWDKVTAFLATAITDDERQRINSTNAIDNFHLDSKELHYLQQHSSDNLSLAKAWKAVLKQRMEDYQQHGLETGIAITSSNKTVNPNEQLATATDSMAFVQGHFPDFIGYFRQYPANHGAYPEEYFISIEEEDGRPVFALKHQIVDSQSDYSLIAERQFYISHSLDSLQVTILCLADGEHTLVGLLNHAFTGKVSGMGQAIAHRIGRSKVREKTAPMFEALRARFTE